MKLTTKRHARVPGVIAVIVGAAVALSGCVTSPSAAPTEDESISIAISLFSSAIPFYEEAGVGATDAAEKSGDVTIEIAAPAEQVVDKAIANATSLLSKQPDGFGVNPCGGPSWNRVMKEIASGVTSAVTWGCFPAGSSEQIADLPIPTFVGASDLEMGRTLAEQTVNAASLPESSTGTALLGNCAPGTPNLDNRVIGFTEALAELLPMVEVVEFKSNPDKSMNLQSWSDRLSQNPDTVIAMGACEGDGINLATLKGKDNADWALGVTVPNKQQLPFIESGLIQAGVTSSGYLQGYTVASLLIESVRSGTPLPEGWIDTGIYTITTDNVGEWIEANANEASLQTYLAKIADPIIADPAAHTRGMTEYFD